MINDSRPLLGKVLDLLLDAVCIVDSEGRFVFVSAACERLFGYTREELIGKNMIDLVHPDDRERTLQTAADIMGGNPITNFENRYIRKDGRVVDIMWSARWSQSDRVRLAVARDVTELKRNERIRAAIYQILEASYTAESLFALCQHIHRIISGMLPAENFCVAMYDEARNTLAFPYFVDDREQSPDPGPLDFGSPLAEIIRNGQALLACTKKSGTGPDSSTHHIYADWLGVPLISNGKVIGAIVLRNSRHSESYTVEQKDLLQFISSQITVAIERKLSETRLHQMAWYDALTGLPNRVLFQDRFDMALRRARRDKEHLALLYLDLDGFKEINDRYGHEIGDELLCEVAQRLNECVREADTIGRRGGDEFTILLTNIQDPDFVDKVNQRIRSALNAPLELDGHRLTVSTSIGVAVYPDHGDERDRLFRHADANMYTVKRREG